MGRKIIDHVLILNGGILKMWESSMTEKQKSSKYLKKITHRGMKEEHEELDLCSSVTKGHSYMFCR